jgi:hypothetical protein
MKLGVRGLLVVGGLWAGAAAGCNLIFGVSSGVLAGTGGSASSGSAGHGGSGGGCDPFAGDALTYLTDMPTANIPTLMMYAGDSVSGTYYGDGDYTELKTGSNVPGYCDIGTIVDLAGRPKVGTYTLVATSPHVAGFVSGTKTAFVFATATPSPTDADAGCETLTAHAFGSVAGVGSVNVTGVSGTQVTFTVTGVQADGLVGQSCDEVDVACDGMGTLQIDIKDGHSDCFQTDE